jgi:hypothetical protein
VQPEKTLDRGVAGGLLESDELLLDAAVSACGRST